MNATRAFICHCRELIVHIKTGKKTTAEITLLNSLLYGRWLGIFISQYTKLLAQSEEGSNIFERCSFEEFFSHRLVWTTESNGLPGSINAKWAFRFTASWVSAGNHSKDCLARALVLFERKLIFAQTNKKIKPLCKNRRLDTEW